MFAWRWLAIMVAALSLAPEVLAQIPLYPAPVGISGHGVGFRYHGRRLAVGGFWGTTYPLPAYVGVPVWGGPYPSYPYGVANNRVTVNIIAPNIVAPPVPRLSAYEYDLRGVDLDVEPPPQAFGPRLREKPRVDLPPPRAQAKPAEAPPAKKVAEAPPAKKVAEVPPQQPPPALPPPKDNPGEESDRLLDLGLKAFKEGEYGVAALRFRQASVIEPGRPKAYFLLSQALFALGKYGEAVAAIEAGMLRQPNWPRTPFQPFLDLYKGREAEFAQHMQWLEQSVAQKAAPYAVQFLYAHQLWFDGRRMAALPIFRRARELAVNPAFIEAFLRAALPGPLAAN